MSIYLGQYMDNTSKSGMYSAFASTCKKSEILVTIVEKNNIDDSDISVSALLFAIDTFNINARQKKSKSNHWTLP